MKQMTTAMKDKKSQCCWSFRDLWIVTCSLGDRFGWTGIMYLTPPNYFVFASLWLNIISAGTKFDCPF